MARDATEYPTMHRIAPQQKVMQSSVNSAIVRKPCNKHKVCLYAMDIVLSVLLKAKGTFLL